MKQFVSNLCVVATAVILSLAPQAWGQNPFYMAVIQQQANGGDISLQSVVASTVFDLDATIAASYPGTGTTWANLAAIPADGSAQTAYDFHTGDGATSTTYPTFTGTAGNAAAFWSFDGGDYFTLKSGSAPTFLGKFHNTDGDNWWIAFAFRQANNTANAALLSIGKTSVTNSVAGFAAYANSAESMFLNQANGAAGNSATVNGGTFAVGTDFLVILSFNKSTNTLTVWRGSTTGTPQSWVYNASTVAVTGAVALGASTSLASPQPSGFLLYGVYGGNEYLDDTKAAAIIAHLEARHGRDYTP